MLKLNFIKVPIIVLMVAILCSCSGKKPDERIEPTQTPLPTEQSNTATTPPPADINEDPDTTDNQVPKETSSFNTPLPTNNAVLDPDATPITTNKGIWVDFDKGTAKVGEIIKAQISIKGITNFLGYQINMKYDPKVLEAVHPDTGEPLDIGEPPSGGTLIQNPEYGVFPIAKNDLENGVLNFGSVYLNANEYKKAGQAKSDGTIAVIGFKILNTKETAISFEDTSVMPNAKSGVQLFDWDGKTVQGFDVIQPPIINKAGE